MGYDLHVRRFSDGAAQEIDETEWLDFVRRSPHFELKDEISFPTPSGERVTVRGPFGCWTGHPSVEAVPFRWFGGQVTVSFGDGYVVEGALLVADALDATVVGDEGEEYDAPLGPEHLSPLEEFVDSDEPRSEPVGVDVSLSKGAPAQEELIHNFDGGESIWDRLRSWTRRQR